MGSGFGKGSVSSWMNLFNNYTVIVMTTVNPWNYKITNINMMDRKRQKVCELLMNNNLLGM